MYHRKKLHGTTKHLSIVLDFRLLAQKFLTHSGFAAMALQQWSRAFWEHQTWSDKWRALAFFQASLMETLIMNVVFGGLRLAGWSGSAHICLWWWGNQAGPIIQAMQGWWVQYWSACKEGHCKQAWPCYSNCLLGMHNPNYRDSFAAINFNLSFGSEVLDSLGFRSHDHGFETPVSPGEQFITLLTIVTVKTLNCFPENLESDCCTGVTAWTCLRLSLNFDRIYALQSSDLWACSVENQDSKFLRSTWMLLTSVFSPFETPVEQSFQDQGPFWAHSGNVKPWTWTHQWRPLAFFKPPCWKPDRLI